MRLPGYRPYLLSEKKPAGDVDPAVFGLEVLALRTAATAGPAHNPDHRLEAVLDWTEVHANPLYPGHLGLRLRPGRERKPERILPRWSGRVGSDNISLYKIQTQTRNDL